MKEYGFLIIAAVGIGFYYLQPVLERWHKRLEADLSRMKKSDAPQDPVDDA